MNYEHEFILESAVGVSREARNLPTRRFTVSTAGFLFTPCRFTHYDSDKRATSIRG
jgi:hypothetical protein